jgi:hypothetical protein
LERRLHQKLEKGRASARIPRPLAGLGLLCWPHSQATLAPQAGRTQKVGKVISVGRRHSGAGLGSAVGPSSYQRSVLLAQVVGMGREWGGIVAVGGQAGH